MFKIGDHNKHPHCYSQNSQAVLWKISYLIKVSITEIKGPKHIAICSNTIQSSYLPCNLHQKCSQVSGLIFPEFSGKLQLTDNEYYLSSLRLLIKSQSLNTSMGRHLFIEIRNLSSTWKCVRSYHLHSKLSRLFIFQNSDDKLP